MVVVLDIYVDGVRSAVLSSRWKSLSVTLTDDDTEDAATLTLSAGVDLELPPRSASLRFAANGIGIGSFEAHRLRGDTRAGTVVIEAAVVSPDSELRTQRDGSWEAQKVGDVIAAIADRAGLTPVIDPDVGGLPAAAAVQVGESDLAFARRLVADAGGRLLVQDDRLIVTRGDRARGNLPTLDVDLRADGTWVDWSRGWRRTLASVRATYLLEDGSTTAFVDVGGGEGASRPRVLPTVYPSREAAASAAAAFLAGAETSRDSVNLGGAFLPAANVLQPLRIVGGEDRIPGGLPPLIVRRLQHSIGRNAATTTIAATAITRSSGEFVTS